MELLPFGYIEPESCIERRFGESSSNNYLAIPNEDLYDYSKIFSKNVEDGRDKYLVLKISVNSNQIGPYIPDDFAICLSTPSKLMEIQELEFLIHDYDTIFGIRYPRFRNYDPHFFSCEERVLFEVLLIKFKNNQFKMFRWEKSKIGYELGINRGRRDTIIKKFKSLGIIKSAVAKSCKGKNGRNANSYFFNLDCNRILELLPEIFSDFNKEEVLHDLKKYLHPAFSD